MSAEHETTSTTTTLPPAAVAVPSSKSGDEIYLWKMTLEEIKSWLHGTHPLFPKPPQRKQLSSNMGEYEQMEEEKKFQTKQTEYTNKLNESNTQLSNLCMALQSASKESSSEHHDSNHEPHAKRIKTEKYPSQSDKPQTQRDIFNILDPSFSRGKNVVHLPGAILARITIGGLMNAMAGQRGGVVQPTTAKPMPGSNVTDTTTIPTAGSSNITVEQLRTKAIGLSHVIAARLEMDMMQSTPKRIIEMLCPKMTLGELVSIRRRIYDTVVLGRGTNASANAAALERADDLPVAARVGMHDIDKYKKCKVCGNNDQGGFVLDRKNGDLICTECGTIATESLMHEGSQFRKFEGEEDRNHHGDVANPLYSNAYNMGTSLSGVSMSVGAGVAGWGSGGRGAGGLETILKNIHNYTEMNISQFGKEEKKTRVGYKDRQKKEAFVQMTHVADALSLHQAVLQRAKELFAGFRDDRELVQQFKGVLAACLCEAFDQLSKDGQQLLKVRAGEEKNGAAGSGTASNKNVATAHSLSARASRRSELHSSNLAGKGGLFLNTENAKKEESLTNSQAPMNEAEKKPVSTWNLDDTRSWLLEASKSIAKQWHKTSPKGTLAEIEGSLVQHTLTLCSLLEQELARGGAKGAINRQKVVTPRVQMGTLGIKWQHKHERGSGGAGGVGNSGRGVGRPGQARMNGRSAGQILILKTAKKLSEAIQDQRAGEAFHRELSALRSRQEAHKRRLQRDVASAQRLNQMKRKPWLQARVQSS